MWLLFPLLVFQISGDELKGDVAPTVGTYAVNLDCSHSVNETCFLADKLQINCKLQNGNGKELNTVCRDREDMTVHNVNFIYFL